MATPRWNSRSLKSATISKLTRRRLASKCLTVFWRISKSLHNLQVHQVRFSLRMRNTLQPQKRTGINYRHKISSSSPPSILSLSSKPRPSSSNFRRHYSYSSNRISLQQWRHNFPTTGIIKIPSQQISLTYYNSHRISNSRAWTSRQLPSYLGSSRTCSICSRIGMEPASETCNLLADRNSLVTINSLIQGLEMDRIHGTYSSSRSHYSTEIIFHWTKLQ